MISITDNAIKKLKGFVKPTEVVRLAVEGGGCNGFQYRFGVSPSTEIAKDDHITEATDGVRLCIDPISYAYLENVEIDFEESTFSSAFKLNNPDVKATCGCGSSFS
jgi:iron-sulfur cluster assembly accessory protein